MSEGQQGPTWRRKVERFLVYRLGLSRMCPRCGEDVKAPTDGGPWVCNFCMHEMEEL